MEQEISQLRVSPIFLLSNPLGIIGALGDQQDKGERKTLRGLNKVIEDDAEKNMLLSK